MVPTLHKYNIMRKEYQIRNEQQDILFRCTSWRTANAMLDKCPNGCFVFEDEFYDNEP